MIIVTGHLTVKPGQRERHLELSAEAVQRARESARVWITASRRTH